MSLIQAIEISQEFSSHYVLRNVSCTIEHNSRIGLIGSNGSGKSTLIKIMLGTLQPSEGKVLRAKKCRVAYLPQNLQLDPHLVMLDYVRSSRPDFEHLNHEIQRLSESLRESFDKAVEERLEQVVNSYHNTGAYDFENQVKYVLESLKFPPALWHKKIGEFSGGEQTRICLAAILLSPFDLLILDEPTNHLDIAMISWLESYLSKLNQPFLVVSHDRRFLDNTVRSIYSLRGGSLSITKGNYSSFKEADEIARLAQEKAAKEQAKWIAETEDFIARNMAGQKTNQAKSRLKQLEKVERISAPQEATKLKLHLGAQSRTSNTLYRLESASFGICNLLLARDVELYAHYRDRVAIIGPNGCGKTTLLKLLLGKAEPQEGKIYRGANLEIGYYDQHQINLDDSLTVKETIWQLAPLEPIGYVLGWLARFGFIGDDVDKRVSILSGGERSRLYLSVLIHQKPNLLILDEPTNHLDIELTDSLLEALQDYDGSIIFVSHDRYFIEALATRYWVFRRKIDPLELTKLYPTIEDMDQDLAAIINASFTDPELQTEKVDNRSRKKKLNPWYLKQLHEQIEKLEAELEDLAKSLESIHLKLAAPVTYADQALLYKLREEMQELERLEALKKQELGSLEEKYLEMSYE